MKRFNFWLPLDLFNRVRLMAKFYKISTTEMMVKLLEMGYLKMLEQGGYDNEIND